jgi:hypothetical protein
MTHHTRIVLAASDYPLADFGMLDCRCSEIGFDKHVDDRTDNEGGAGTSAVFASSPWMEA